MVKQRNWNWAGRAVLQKGRRKGKVGGGGSISSNLAVLSCDWWPTNTRVESEYKESKAQDEAQAQRRASTVAPAPSPA